MRLLLAEDERELSDALCAILKHNHYSVDPVYNGRDALDYIQAGQYDGAILDIMMPGLDGLSVLQYIREEGNVIPVLLLTAKSQVDDRIVGWTWEPMITWSSHLPWGSFWPAFAL